MPAPTRAHLLALSTAFALLAHGAPAQSPPQTTQPPQRLALLVGIGTYPGDAPMDLAGPPNDIVLVEHLLRERFDFPAAGIRVLRDQDATHAAIVETFRSHLIAQATAASEVVFWYCGHGSRIKDASGREADGLDNSLVAYDSRKRAPEGGYDVSDDELYTLLQQLAAITDHIVLVTDSCHAESSFRGADGEPEERPGIRYTHRGTAPLDLALTAPLWKATPILDDDSPARHPIDDRFVHVAACASWQLAGERERVGKTYGLLTWHLVRALERAEPGATWRQIVERVQLFVQEERASQTPTFDGRVDREVFGGKFVAPPRGIPARLAPSDARGYDLVLDAGELMGVQIGSEFTVHPFHGDQQIGKAAVTELLPDGLRAQAKWTGARPELERGTPLRVIEIARPANLDRLPVAVPRPGFVAERKLEAWLVEVPMADAEFVLEPAADDVGITLRTVDGAPIWPSPDSAGNSRPDAPRTTTAMDVVKNAVRFRALARLPLQPGTCCVAAKFVTPNEEDRQQCSYPVADVEPEGGAGSQWRVVLPAPEGDKQGKALAVLDVVNRGNATVYFAVISLADAGCRRNDIFGPPDDVQTSLAPGEHKRVLVALSRPRLWPLSRPMRDRYVVVATLAPFPIKRLTSWEDAPMRSYAEPLPWVLHGAFEAPAEHTRGWDPDDAQRGWGTTWLDLHVR